MKTSIILVLTLALITQVFGGWGNYGEKVLLNNVNALTFHKGKYTAASRSAAIPQLNCVGGSAQGYYKYEPDVVQCKNMGLDDSGNIQWKCEAELDTSVRFGRTDVSCEGFTNPDDPYILKGSCGLEYTLEFTDQGKQRQSYGGYHNSYPNDYHYSSGSSFSFGNFILWCIILFISYQIIKQCMYNMGYYGDGTGATYGTGAPYGGAPYGTGAPGSAYSYPSYPSTPAPTGGFWSGFTTGGLLGYLFSRPSYYPSYGYGYRPSYGGWSSGWSSGGWGSSSRSSGFGGSSTRTSSGFGTTRKR